MSMNARTANPKFAFESFSAHGQIRRNHAMPCKMAWQSKKKRSDQVTPLGLRQTVVKETTAALFNRGKAGKLTPT
jgi:hypothetical protein